MAKKRKTLVGKFLQKASNTAKDTGFAVVNVASSPVTRIVNKGKPLIGSQRFANKKYGNTSAKINKTVGTVALIGGAAIGGAALLGGGSVMQGAGKIGNALKGVGSKARSLTSSKGGSKLLSSIKSKGSGSLSKLVGSKANQITSSFSGGSSSYPQALSSSFVGGTAQDVFDDLFRHEIPTQPIQTESKSPILPLVIGAGIFMMIFGGGGRRR